MKEFLKNTGIFLFYIAFLAICVHFFWISIPALLALYIIDGQKEDKNK